MKLVINKFPQITQKCEIDLSKKAIIFVGKNNSGKTYVSQFIWEIYNLDFEYLKSDIKYYNFISNINISNISLQIDKILPTINRNFSKYIKNKIVSIFKKNINFDGEIVFEKKDILNIKINSKIKLKNGAILKLNKRKSSFKLNIVIDNKNDIDEINKLIEFLVIKSILNKESVYMPAGRLFFTSFYKYIFLMEKCLKDQIVENISKINENNKDFFDSSYTKPVDEVLRKFVLELEKSKNNNYLTLLNGLIDGKIEIKKSENIGIAEIYYIKDNIKLPMFLSSSMVNQLATIYLYFKYWYDEKINNFLLIDEPEMNLHPENKIKISEILLDFASQNKLLIATHSTTIAKTIINYLHLFDLKEKEVDINNFIKENDLNMKNFNLKRNDIGIYYFNGNTIIPYKKDNDSDIHFGTFTKIEKKLENDYWFIIDKKDEFDS